MGRHLFSPWYRQTTRSRRFGSRLSVNSTDSADAAIEDKPLDLSTTRRLWRQADLFNRRWKAYEDRPLTDSQRACARLMLRQKQNAQLLLLEYGSPEVVSLLPDPDDPELFLVGLVGEDHAKRTHIPRSILLSQLPSDILSRWSINQ